MYSLQQAFSNVTAPQGYTMVIQFVVGGIMKGLVELASKNPNLPNTLAVPVIVVFGIALSWAFSLVLAPGLDWDTIIGATLAGYGLVSAGKSTLEK